MNDNDNKTMRKTSSSWRWPYVDSS